MLGILLGTIIGVVIITWFFYWKPYSYWKNQGVPQTNPIIFIGDNLSFILRKENMMFLIQRIYYMYPKARFTGLYQFSKNTLMLKDPEIIKQIAIKDFDYFMDHTQSLPDGVDDLWSKNLFALRGQKWKDMRATLSGSFTSSKLKIMYTLISESSKNFVNYFLQKNEDLIELEMKDAFTRFTNDVIASTSFGIQVDSLVDQDNEFYIMGKQATDFKSFTILLKFIIFAAFPKLTQLLGIQLFSKQVREFFSNIIDQTIKIREEKGIVRPDMINLLLEIKNGKEKHEAEHEVDNVVDNGFAALQESAEIINKVPKRKMEITNVDITAQAMIFFLAGFDTVSSAMCFLCYELAMNPDCQEKLRNEIKKTSEECNGNVTYEALLKMKYMDMAVSECLRKWPGTPVADRVCVKPYTLQPVTPEDPIIHFQKDDVVWIPFYAIHHDALFWPEPEKFIPERFSEGNRSNIIPGTYMPFGVGPRACIGNRFALVEVKSVIFNLLDNFEIVTTEKTKTPLEIDPSSFNLLPIGGFPLGLKRLKK